MTYHFPCICELIDLFNVRLSWERKSVKFLIYLSLRGLNNKANNTFFALKHMVGLLEEKEHCERAG
jgi:hypothetical protein